jgi:hypothetical protein
MSIIPALRRWRQEDCKFKDSLGYTVSPCLKKEKERMGREGSEGEEEERKGGGREGGRKEGSVQKL